MLKLVAILIAVLGGLPSAAAQSGPARANDRALDTLQRRIDESDMLARARAEHSGSAFGHVTGSESANTADGDDVRERALDTELQNRLREAERQAELDELSARLNRRFDARAPQFIPPHPDVHADRQVGSAAPSSVPNYAQRGVAASPSDSSAHRATIVLALKPGQTGIRRFNASADPILCIAQTCWISRGPNQDAKAVRRAKALGPLNTFGNRADACNDSTTCVFRNVDLGAATAIVQPVDLRMMRHDRREALEVGIDPTCRTERSGLACQAMQGGLDYRVWIVPEAVAADAGARALQAFAAGARTDRRSAVVGSR